MSGNYLGKDGTFYDSWRARDRADAQWKQKERLIREQEEGNRLIKEQMDRDERRYKEQIYRDERRQEEIWRQQAEQTRQIQEAELAKEETIIKTNLISQGINVDSVNNMLEILSKERVPNKIINKIQELDEGVSKYYKSSKEGGGEFIKCKNISYWCECLWSWEMFGFILGYPFAGIALLLRILRLEELPIIVILLIFILPIVLFIIRKAHIQKIETINTDIRNKNAEIKKKNDEAIKRNEERLHIADAEKEKIIAQNEILIETCTKIYNEKRKEICNPQIEQALEIYENVFYRKTGGDTKIERISSTECKGNAMDYNKLFEDVLTYFSNQEELMNFDNITFEDILAKYKSNITKVKETTKEEIQKFSVVLKETGVNKIAVIRVIREVTGIGLKEAKEIVDGAPKTIKKGITKEYAEEIKNKFVNVGALVELQCEQNEKLVKLNSKVETNDSKQNKEENISTTEFSKYCTKLNYKDRFCSKCGNVNEVVNKNIIEKLTETIVKMIMS